MSKRVAFICLVEIEKSNALQTHTNTHPTCAHYCKKTNHSIIIVIGKAIACKLRYTTHTHKAYECDTDRFDPGRFTIAFPQQRRRRDATLYNTIRIHAHKYTCVVYTITRYCNICFDIAHVNKQQRRRTRSERMCFCFLQCVLCTHTSSSSSSPSPYAYSYKA